MNLFDQVQQTASMIKKHTSIIPETGVILGTGLGDLASIVDTETEIPYDTIPNFPVSTVAGHEGKLIFGRLNGKQVMMMSGRFHYYEGYSMHEITFPVRVMKALGVQSLIVSNAAGGMNKSYKIGDLVIITDHINLFPEHPLRGANDDRLGPRFPDMSEPYNRRLISLAKTIAAEQGIEVHTGVYTGIQGPTFETSAEYRWLHTIGGDLVGMSTVPEAIVAIHAGIKVFGASIVTDIGISDGPLIPLSLEDVLAAANEAAPRLAGLTVELIKRM